MLLSDDFGSPTGRSDLFRRLAAELVRAHRQLLRHVAARQHFNQLLRENGLVQSDVRVKVLARGEIGKALTVRAHKFSGKAAEKIAAAGGATEVIA